MIDKIVSSLRLEILDLGRYKMGFLQTCSIYLPSIEEYACSPNDILSDCLPINAFSLLLVC